MKLKKELSFFDLTNIVVGSIIGSDIYIASAITAGMIGPASILVWILAAVFATVMALVFAYSSYYVPKVGGPFAFVSEAFDDFFGFLCGWSMWIAEMVSLPVFAIVFTNYLEYFIKLDSLQSIAVKGLFVFVLTYINIVGVKRASKTNNILTIIKLSPLLLIVAAGLFYFVQNPSVMASNYSPLFPIGTEQLGTALVLIFWAYVGFEMGTLPASEVKDAKRTIHKAIATGMLIVTVFYLSTNFVVYGAVNWKDLAKTSTPLILVGSTLLGAFGAAFIALGSLASVSGSDESGTLGTARLSYAMAIDGLFPKVFSKVHPKYGTPYAALIIQGVIAFALSLYSSITSLISFSVFNLSLCFLLVCLSLIVLKGKKGKGLYGQDVLPWVGIAISLYLLYSTSLSDKITGAAIMIFGIFLYVFLSPKEDISHLKRMFLSEEAIFARRLERKEKFLANLIRLSHNLYKKLKK